jgi:S-adenosylmethionine uptake transporter
MTTRSLLSAVSRGFPRSDAWNPAARAGLAVALTLLASALFAAQGALVKVGARELPALELVFFRGFVSALVLLAYARAFRARLASDRLGGQTAFGVLGFVSLALYFAAIARLPLVTATALNYTAPIFVALFVALEAGRRASAVLLWVAGGFAGACLVLQPSLAGESSAGVLLGLGSGVTAAAAYLLLGRLARAGEHQRVTSFHYSVAVCGLAGLLTLADGGFAISTWHQVRLVVGIGLLATFAQLALFKAYALAAPVVPATVSYSVVIFSSVLGAALWGDQVGFMESLGIALIVASGVLVSVAQGAAPAGKARPAFRWARGDRWRGLRSAWAAYRLAMDPSRTACAFVISDTQDEIAERERAAGRVYDPFASQALERMWHTRFRAALYDLDELARLPADTLGGAYARHMKANNLRVDYYEIREPRDRITYVRQRMRHTHDVWHVVTGFGTDPVGEVALQGFCAAQISSGQAPLICAAFILRAILEGRLADVEKLVDAFCEGYCNGKRAESLLEVEWEAIWSEPLARVRERYGVAAGISLPRRGLRTRPA